LRRTPRADPRRAARRRAGRLAGKVGGAGAPGSGAGAASVGGPCRAPGCGPRKTLRTWWPSPLFRART